jgi:hypothetical protein
LGQIIWSLVIWSLVIWSFGHLEAAHVTNDNSINQLNDSITRLLNDQMSGQMDDFLDRVNRIRGDEDGCLTSLLRDAQVQRFVASALWKSNTGWPIRLCF